MKIMVAFMLLLLPWQSPKPTPSPTPAWTGNIITSATTTTAPIMWATALNTPRMVIHFEGNIILEINGADGKHLIVAADGKITGDLPHDAAADEFWRSIASAFPSMCEWKSKALKR